VGGASQSSAESRLSREVSSATPMIVGGIEEIGWTNRLGNSTPPTIIWADA
jgi:hypothetical protein